MIVGRCMDCGEKIIINSLVSGTCGNQYVPSHSYCVCPDRDTNPQKKIHGKVIYHNEKKLPADNHTGSAIYKG